MKPKHLISILVVCLVLSVTGLANASGLTDTGNHWAKPQIDKMVQSGYVKGYPDGTFKPDQPINRAEFVTVVNLAFGKLKNDVTVNFSDVSNTDWYYKQVASSVYAGFSSGYPDKSFKPNKAITREEAAAILAKLLKLDTSISDEAKKFTDAVKIGDWARGSVAAVFAKKVMSGYPDGSFKPGKQITRAEAVTAVNQALSLSQTLTIPRVAAPSSGGGGGGGGGGSSLPAELESFRTLVDPMGDTLVVINVKSASAGTVKIVTVKGQNAVRIAGTNEWRVTLSGSQSVGAGDFALVSVASIVSLTDPLGDTLVKVKFNGTVTGVTVKGQTTVLNASGEWCTTLNGVQSIAASEVLVTPGR